MSGLPGSISRAISTRNKSAVDVERENFEKAQTASIQKAINSNECAVKEKHARVVIIGAHHDKSAMFFWNIALRLPYQENPIVAWKFCHVVHKLLRDGPAPVIKDSSRFTKTVVDFGRLWGHLKEGYGQLIAAYAKLIVQKIKFHMKNIQIPGSLLLEDDQLETICNRDVNLFFELGVDMMDYMDVILGLQRAVFGSLDMSRANSMTSSGQCRLAPLILCILDSCPLYDCLVKILFRLHSSLPPDTLSGHRERFLAQYKSLRHFYINASNLQYFKNLIKVPSLPDSPPNFLHASDLAAHVKPMAIVPEPDVSDVDSQNEMDLADQITDQLVDTSSSSQDELSFQNGLAAAAVPDDRDRQIEQLRWEVSQLKRELARLKAEDQMVIESLHNRVRELEMEVNELRQIAEATTNEAEILRAALKNQEKSADVASRLEMVEKISKSNEEKFVKMKDIYGKLREEHIKLLKTHSDSAKLLSDEKKSKEDALEKQRALCKEVEELKRDKSRIESTLVMSSDATEKLESLTRERDALEREKRDLDDKLQTAESSRAEMERSMELNQFEATRLRAELESAKASKVESERLADKHRTEVEQLKKDLENALGSQASVASTLSERAAEVARLTGELEAAVAAKLAAEKTGRERQSESDDLKERLQKVTSENATLSASVTGQERELNELKQRLETAAGDLEKETKRAAQQQSDINSLQQRIASITAQQEAANQKLKDSESLVQKLQGELSKLQSERLSTEAALRRQISDEKRKMIQCAAVKGEAIIQDALSQADNPQHSTITCTAEYLLNRTQPAIEALHQLTQLCNKLSSDDTAVGETVKSLCEFSHHLSDSVIFGFATARTAASIEAGEVLSASSKASGDESLTLLGFIKTESYRDIPSQSARVEAALKKLMSQAEELLPKIADVEAEKMGDMIEDEMQTTTKAIEEAAAKIAEMLAASRANCSGIQLEVNESILESCNKLMMAIRVLIEKSKSMQREIVAQGRGTSSVKEFYKKHHRWTEGLISAAKTVGLGANALVDAADRVVKGKGKYEELIVCSNEIAASTTQLVVASKVKANRGSENLHHLADASKGVSTATGQVVASAKSAAERIEESETMDFSKLSLTQAKKMEMECQVHVLELESKLEKERRNLAELRKVHYKLAAESEGWEQEDWDDSYGENQQGVGSVGVGSSF